MLEYIIFPITGNSDNSVESQNNTTDKKKNNGEGDRVTFYYSVILVCEQD